MAERQFPHFRMTFQTLRRILVQMPPQEAMLKLVDRLGRTKTNEEFLMTMNLN